MKFVRNFINVAFVLDCVGYLINQERQRERVSGHHGISQR